MTRRGEIPGPAGNDKGPAGKDKGPAGNGDNHTVTPNNIHLESSFTISKDDFESEKHEWAAHNAMHAMGIARRQTAHADLNWPQPWLIRLGYAIVGSIAWPFIK